MTRSKSKGTICWKPKAALDMGPGLLVGLAGLLVLTKVFLAAPLSEDVCFGFGLVGWGIVHLNAQRLIDSNGFFSYAVAGVLFAFAQAAVGALGTGIARAVFMAGPLAAIVLLRISLQFLFPNYPTGIKPVILLSSRSWKGAPHYKPSVRERIFSIGQFLGIVLWSLVGKMLL